MSLTLADILRQHWPAYRRKHRRHLAAAHYRAVQRVLRCRTPELGGRLYRCDDCKKPHFAYHSCNHRSCPQCGAADQAQWSTNQEARLLPVAYFMVTFTIPSELRTLCAKHPAELYNLLIKTSATALKNLIVTKYHGAEPGFTSILHTWGRQLQHHPHIHTIIPAAALQRQTDKILQPANNHFLIHHRPLSQHFRNLMRQNLKTHHPEIHNTLSPAQHRCLSKTTTWNVQLQHVGKGKTAIRYLARYVRKSGYTDKRLIGYTPDQKHILLRWTCSKTRKPGTLKLSIEEFIRRWLLHVLPKGFTRLRHYGYLSPAAKNTRLRIRLLLGAGLETPPKIEPTQAHACPHCQGTLHFLRELPRLNPMRGPPQKHTIT